MVGEDTGDEVPPPLGDAFVQLRERLFGDSAAGLDPRLVVRLAARAMPGPAQAALTLLRAGRRPQTVAATGDLGEVVDALQHEVREGPLLDPATDDSVTIVGDLAADERWPAFADRLVAETGVRSMLVVRLMLSGEDQAAMSMYSRERGAFGDLELGVASMFAPFASLSLQQWIHERAVLNFEAALSSSRQIGTAMGIVMARNLVTSDEAFELLRQASLHLNRKLRDIAAEVEETGEIPSAGSSPTARENAG